MAHLLARTLRASLPRSFPRARSVASTPVLLDKLFTSTHEWVNVTGNTAVIGVTDYAQKLLGEVTYIDFPEVGADLVQNESFGAIESVKAASDLNAPVSGKVVEINQAVKDDFGLVNKNPESDAWLVKIQVKNAGELKSLKVCRASVRFWPTSCHARFGVRHRMRLHTRPSASRRPTSRPVLNAPLSSVSASD
eukprot:m.30203 g.30203  ORF g.30203 m.30203 type:complete len:193 (+) comp40972_c0_seq1:45-623(+)